MRIRKLLGRTSEYGAAQLPRSPWVSSAPVLAAKEVENRNDREEEEMMAGFVNHVFEAEEDEGAEAKVEDEEAKKEEKMRLRRMKEIATEENKRAGTKCKKTDGRGWHCKRDAQHPHTLCGYHLAQLRSYRARVEEKVTGDGERCHRRKQSAAAMEAGNYYYYYSILGPRWGKRRAPVDGSENPGFNDERNDKTDPDAFAAHEEDDEEDNDDDEDDNDEGSCSCGDDDSEVANHEKKKKKSYKKKKRGRKPVKARSLKSLL